MGDAIIGIVFSGILALLGFIVRKDVKERHEMKVASGVIEKVTESEGFINYHITFTAEGRTMTGKSSAYSISTKQLHKGDFVSINYYMTKAGWPRVIILDDEMESCAESGKGAAKIFWGLSAAFFLAAIIMLIQSLL